MAGKAVSPASDPPLWDAAETLTDSAYRQLEEEIVTLRIPPRSVVSEALLAKRFNIGRTPIREALQRLAREGLVLILPRRGIVVSDIDVAAQLRLLEVRRELERLLSRGAAQRASREQRTRFEKIAAGMENAGRRSDDLAFMRLDRAFNLLLLEACGNEFGVAALRLMNGLSRRFWYAHYQTAADLPRTAQLHATAARAIASGNAEAAAAASDELIGYIQDFARKSIG